MIIISGFKFVSISRVLVAKRFLYILMVVVRKLSTMRKPFAVSYLNGNN